MDEPPQPGRSHQVATLELWLPKRHPPRKKSVPEGIITSMTSINVIEEFARIFRDITALAKQSRIPFTTLPIRNSG